MARVDAPRGRKKGGEKIAHIRRDESRVERGCGVIASRRRCNRPREMAQLRGRVSDLVLEDTSKIFNTEIPTAIGLPTWSRSPRRWRSQRQRGASRAARTRAGFPHRDDQESSSLSGFDARWTALAVTITRFHRERKY